MSSFPDHPLLSGAEATSVVVPFGGNPDLLRVQLLALLDQDYPGQVEVVIACNSKMMDLAGLDLPELPPRTALTVLDATSVKGPSHARNIGWRHCSTNTVLFCDADDRVDPHWVGAMVGGLQASPLVGGRLCYEALNDAQDVAWNRQSTVALPRKFRHLQFVASSNFGARRHVLEQMGGFDERLTCGEDIDFCWRAQYHGFTVAFVPEARVEYRLRADVKSIWKQSVAYGTSDALLLRRHARFGARRPLADTVAEAAAIVLALLRTPLQPSLVRKVAVRAGMFVGRVRGSVQYRKWAI
ncbi:glycosyltransferase [Pseudarthrobacter phenanthrenivorans]|uniref:glycosyltransferase n=1 Tax=Pseudarthrobacter phenanthrenivorans TaxID=361575 RepID=UPI002F35B77C